MILLVFRFHQSLVARVSNLEKGALMYSCFGESQAEINSMLSSDSEKIILIRFFMYGLFMYGFLIKIKNYWIFKG
jgi:hypothetical protein